MKNKFIYFAVLAAMGFASCEPEFDNELSNANYSAGEADFSRYVAVGNSLTAGYMDGTVSRGGQVYSYPNLLSQKFALVGGGEFTQPSYADDINNLGGLTLGGMQIGNTRLVIDFSAGGPEPIAGTSTIEVSNLQAKAYNNMGVPGAKSFHLLASGYGNVAGVAVGMANPYFVRHASTPTATVLEDAMSKNPTFFTNWIGANDVLAYSTSGGAINDNPATTTVDESLIAAADHNATGNMNPATYGGNDITNATVYGGVYTQIINALTSGGAKGVVCTIPNVTSIPYFTTVPYKPLTAQGIGKGLVPAGSTTEQQIAAGTAAMNQLNSQLYTMLDGLFTAYGQPNRVNPLDPTKANPILIHDVDAIDRSTEITGALTPLYGAAIAGQFGAAFGKCRQSASTDLIVLPASSVIGTSNPFATAAMLSVGANKNGVSYPISNKYVLTANEALKATNATSAYNNAIRSIAASKGLAVADMNEIMGRLVSGLRLDDGQIYTANYFAGASNLSTVLFSLDGVHPNARGYAVIANEIIKVINSHYKARLPIHEIGGFPGVTVLGSN
ncbi:G-D-S-L family lipolytic protein [Flavobacterium enshiense]|uniref:SGNH/GDSL hydrolase family protein n=1 Tax=Flavobacterium enshiense TaxID=1341165 RepID=UPI00345D3FF0